MDRNKTGAIKKITSRSMPWAELNRKRFLTSAPKAKVNLQPWPSATNLEESTLSYDSCQHTLSVQSPPPFISIHRGSENQSLDDDTGDLGGFFNSAFSPEHIPEMDKGIAGGSSSSHTIELPEDLAKSKASVRYTIRRPSTASSNSKKRKAFSGRWRRAFDSATAQLRRKTIDCVPAVPKIIPQTSSTPNLKSLTIVSNKDLIIRASSEEQDVEKIKQASCDVISHL